MESLNNGIGLRVSILLACIVTFSTNLQQKGDIRLDALETIDPVDLQNLYGTAKEAVHVEDMPPAKAKQPSSAERKVLVQWLEADGRGVQGPGREVAAV